MKVMWSWFAIRLLAPQPYGYGVDIWAVGITTRECAEGAPPYYYCCKTSKVIDWLIDSLIDTLFIMFADYSTLHW